MNQPAAPYTDADVETVARAIHDSTRCLHRDEWTIEARAALDALTERGRGLAPVVAHQWSVRYPDGFVDQSSFTEAGARQRATELGGEVVYRTVGPWAPAAEVVPA